MTHSSTKPTLAGIRTEMPKYALSYSGALRLAERQANILVTAWGGGHRAIREADVLSLTRLTITRGSIENHDSGRSRYEQGRWHIRVNKNDGASRQRFTIAHELKHIIDAGCNVQINYQNLTDRQIERICDHFAACLLMSERSIRRLWNYGVRVPELLATACNVSIRAMTVRMEILGLPINSLGRDVIFCRRGVIQVPPSEFSPVPVLQGVAP